jgi:hypothetical protein
MAAVNPADRSLRKRRNTVRQTAPPANSGTGGAARYWLLSCLAGLLGLWFSVRNAPLGIPVADDYSFLDRLIFQKPLSLFDSMGGTYYWRPVSRQAYFTLVGPALLKFPWIVPLAHAALLLVVSWLLFRVARRLSLPPLPAALLATYPLVSESARVLLTWPSAAQHLLAMLFVVLAIHEALSGRLLSSALAALAGVLAHESSAIVLPVIPLIAWFRPGDKRGPGDAGRAIRAALFVAGVAVVWMLGYAIARGNGVVLPVVSGEVSGNVFEALRLAGSAALNLEDLSGPPRVGLLLACAALVAFGIGMGIRPQARKRLRGGAAPILVGLVWFVLGTLPLAALLPDWNAWRDSVPGLGFGVATIMLLSLIAPWLGGAFAALRLVALLCAAPAAGMVSAYPPVTTSDMSFVRLTRLQRIADATRISLQRDAAGLPAHGQVRFISIPRMAEVAFQGPDAIRVWYRDSTLTYAPIGGLAGLTSTAGTVVAYDNGDTAWRVVVLAPRAVDLLGRGIATLNTKRWGEASELLLASRAAQSRYSGVFESMVSANLARAAYYEGQIARADSLNQVAGRLGGADTNFWALQSAIAFTNGNRMEAEQAALKSLALDPRNELANGVRSAMSR